MKYVIIGAGAAGISAARTLRKHAATHDEIVIISTDDAVHSRCMLHKFIGGERDVKALSFVPDNFFEENNIRWLPNTTITRIDTDLKAVLHGGGAELYDRLLIATGANSAFPPIGGLQSANGVYGLRHLSDAKAIRKLAETAQNILILGAGLVGLDAAYGLIEMGKKPTVIEMGKTVMPLNMDSRAAATYQSRFEAEGCKFLFESKVTGIETDIDGRIAGVALSCGTVLPCDLLVVAAGVRPAIQFAAEAGLESNRGLTVDKHFLTSDPNIFAAGDATGLSETWPDAVRQGEVAALNMCGIATPFEDATVSKNTVNFFNITTLTVGQIPLQPGNTEAVREAGPNYQRVVLQGGVPLGVILQGDISRSGFWQQLIKNKVNTSNINKPIWKIYFADAYGMNDNGEYEWVN